MMNRLGNALLILIATMLVADPVMACCMGGPQPVDAGLSQSDTPPCHGTKTAVSSAGSTDTSKMTPDLAAFDPQSCPGCGDCASSMAAGDHQPDYFLVTPVQESDELSAPINAASTSPVVRFIIQPLIPSGLPIHSKETPVSLNQTLLI